MHETRGDLESLQRLLDQSYARAGAHLRAIHTPERRLRAADLCDLLRGVCVWDLATVTRAGEPRVAPLDGIFFRARLVVGLTSDSMRARHLRERPAVSASHARGERITVLVHGSAVEIDCDDPAELPLLDCFREAYGWGAEERGGWGKRARGPCESRRSRARETVGERAPRPRRRTLAAARSQSLPSERAASTD